MNGGRGRLGACRSSQGQSITGAVNASWAAFRGAAEVGSGGSCKRRNRFAQILPVIRDVVALPVLPRARRSPRRILKNQDIAGVVRCTTSRC